MKDTFAMRTPIGILELRASMTALKEIRLGARSKASAERPATELLDRAVRQLTEYFEGTRRDFDLPLEPEGTPFQIRVWRELRKIPYGRTITYGELASRVGNPSAARAVGASNGRNPLPIVIPCHRVIGSGGKLVGYGGGLPTKSWLLRLESGEAALAL